MATTINGSAGVITNSGAVYDGLQLGTAVASTSGTSIDFTGIPSWVKRITVMFNGVSTSGTSVPLIQLGDAGGIENTGYDCVASVIVSTVLTAAYTQGFGVSGTHAATSNLKGSYVLTNISGNSWVFNGGLARTVDTTATQISFGSKTLSATLDRIRITTVNGTDTFDAGSINISYE